MKSLISIVAVILVVIMAFGAISSLTDSVASGPGDGSSTTATTTAASSGVSNPDSNVTVDGNLTVYNYFYNVVNHEFLLLFLTLANKNHTVCYLTIQKPFVFQN